MADRATATGGAANRDAAAGFGATAESNDNSQQINDLLDQVRDLMAEDGIDYATAEALTNFARRDSAPVVGNLADLQRMGAIAVTGEIPRNSMPAGQDQEAQESSNIEDAFAEPPAANLSPAGLQTPMGQIDAEGKPTGGNVGDDAGDDGGDTDLSSMTKAELEEEAGRRGVSVTSSMTKQEMIDAINGG